MLQLNQIHHEGVSFWPEGHQSSPLGLLSAGWRAVLLETHGTRLLANCFHLGLLFPRQGGVKTLNPLQSGPKKSASDPKVTLKEVLHQIWMPSVNRGLGMAANPQDVTFERFSGDPTHIHTPLFLGLSIKAMARVTGGIGCRKFP